MKKSLIALAVVALSGAAMAQSSVTLYGVADAGLGKIKSAGNDASNKVQFTSASTMNNGDSRLGVRGVEDLGAGLKIGFNFETGLDLDDGATTTQTFWARQANLSVGGNWGTVKLGRQFTPSYLTTAAYELTGTANYSVLGKTYRYTVFVGEVKPVFDRKYVTLLDYRPDVERMQQAAAYLTGEHDFASFCGNPRMKKSTVRLVDSITVERRKDRVIFTFHGTGFLQNMVRILVGTLLEVGRGYWEPAYVREILLAKDRKLAGPTAPPEGLCLMKVDY